MEIKKKTKSRVIISIVLGSIAVLGLVIVLLSLSCKPYVEPTGKYSIDEIRKYDSGEIVTENNDTNVSSPPISQESYSDIEKRMSGVVWLNPGKVNIDGLYPGASGEYKIKIHNPKSTPIVFTIYPRDPASLTSGYLPLPEDLKRWINIVPSTLTVPAQSTSEVTVTVKMGLRDFLLGKKYEFWIGVMDESQKGIVRSEICSRWMITTRGF